MGQPETEELKTALRDRWFANYKIGTKASGYVGQFFDRKLTGKRLSAKVEGNHGIYKVSITAKANGFDSACSCYIGSDGGCHHCHALAQTFLDDTESFVVIKQKRRQRLHTLADLKAYLDGTTLDVLLKEMKEHGITQTAFAESIGMNPRHLSSVRSCELRNRYYNELGATKLACLWVIENIKPAAARRGKAK